MPAGPPLSSLGMSGNHALSGEHEGRNAGGVQQSGPSHLRRVDDAGFDQVAEFIRVRIVSESAFAALDLLHDDRTFFTGVHGNLAGRFFQSAPYDIQAQLLVTFQAHLLESGDAAQERYAATRDDAFFHGRASCVQSVFHARLLFLHFRFSRRANADHGHTADQLCQAFLELFTVVIAGGLFDLSANLAYTAFQGLPVARAVDDGRVVLVDAHGLRLAEIVQSHGLQADTLLFADDLAARQDGDVVQHGLAAVAEAGGFDGAYVQGPAELVDHQGGKGFAFDVFQQ